jgi:chromosome segregation ATPase
MEIPGPPILPSVVSPPPSPAIQDPPAKNDHERSPVIARSVPSSQDENDTDNRVSVLGNSLREEQEQHEQVQQDWEQERPALTAKLETADRTVKEAERELEIAQKEVGEVRSGCKSMTNAKNELATQLEEIPQSLGELESEHRASDEYVNNHFQLRYSRVRF